MWVFIRSGFVSVVEGKNNDLLQVRSRDRRPLEEIVSMCEKDYDVIINGGTDYKYRIFIEKKEFADVMSGIVKEIDYCNFKEEVEDFLCEPGWNRQLGYIWTTLWSYYNRLELS